MLTFATRLPSSPQAGMPLLVMLHGRGADEADMLSLASYFPQTLFVAPRAPFPAAAWGYGPGWAWYRYLGGVTPHPEDFVQSQTALDALLRHLPAALPVQPGPLILGGFSQGGTMSLAHALRHPGRAHTVLNLSGFLASHPSVQVTPKTVEGSCIYWPHGLLDDAIPHAVAQTGRAALREAGACLVAPDYRIGHTLIEAELADIQELLRNL